MFNSKKIAAFFLFFTVLGSTAIFAQNQPLPQQQQQQQKVEVSDAELNKFAKAFQVIQEINMKAQQEMAEVVEKEGMEIERFNEVHEAAVNPEAEVSATEEEKEQHQKIITEFEAMQASFVGEMEKVIADSGLSTTRYEEIIMGIQSDQELQEKLKKALQG